MELTVSKWGNSDAIRLPKQITKALKISANDTLKCSIQENKLILENTNKIETLTVEKLFKDYQGEPVSSTPVIFESIGNEKW